MKAMLLAGGMSTRLYPLTKQTPKPLVPIAGEPNSGHLMRYLASYGIKDVAINIFYLADKIVESFGDGSKYGVKLEYLREEKLMGSAGALKQMEGFFKDGTFVIVGCDAITNIKLDELIAFHKAKGALATIGLFEADDVEQFGVVVLDNDGRIQGFQEKPKRGTEKSKLVNTGIYIFEPEILSFIPGGQFYDFGNDVFPAILAAGEKFYGLEMKGAYWADIGTLPEYRRATEDVIAGRIVPPGSRHIGVPPSALVDTSAVIAENVRVGERASIGANVKIEGPSIIGDDAVIGAGTVITRSILFGGVKVGENASLKDSIIGLNYEIAAGEKLDDKVLAYENTPAAVA